MQKGYQLAFYIEQNNRHGKQPLYEWLIDTARDLGVTGATVFMGLWALDFIDACIVRISSNF